jgi:hypothetical protein
MSRSRAIQLDQYVKSYLALESFEVTEQLLDLCGATIDARALPVLRLRLHEEEEQVPQLEARGYIRMREKSEQLVRSLTSLITVLEKKSCDTTNKPKGTQH